MRTGRSTAASSQPVLWCFGAAPLQKAEELGDAMEEARKELEKFAMERGGSLGHQAPLSAGPCCPL